MKSLSYSPGNPIKKEDLDYEKYSTQDAIVERFGDIASPGILYGSQTNGEPIPFKITTGVGLKIHVGTGTAISDGDIDMSDPSTPGGERITIPDADVAPGSNYRRDAGAYTGPYHRSDDGLGGHVNTPQSTLTQNIPLTDDSINYIWIGYLRAIDSSVYSLHKITSARSYPRGIDGYDIVVTLTDSAPSLFGNGDYFKLGEVTTASDAITDIDQSMVVFARMKAFRSKTHVNTAVPTATYGDGTGSFSGDVWVDDHINSQGTGVKVKPSNPHRQKLIDFDGIEDIQNFTTQHEVDEHTNGIVSDSSTMGLSPEEITIPPASTTKKIVRVEKLASGEAVHILGQRFTHLNPYDDVSLDGDGYIPFTSDDDSGSYVVYVRIVGGLATLGKSSGSAPAGSLTLGTCTWTNPGYVLTIIDDNRPNILGTISAKNIQINSIDTNKIVNNAVTGAKLTNASVTADKISGLAGDGLTGGTGAKLAVLVETTNPTLKLTTEGDTKELGVKYKADQFEATTNGLTIKDGAITTAKIGTSQITHALLAADAVETANVLDAKITLAKLSADIQVQLNQLSAIGNSIKQGLVVKNKTSSKTSVLTITADTLSIGGNISSPGSVILSNINEDVTSAVQGRGGLLDGQVKTASTWYMVLVITDDTGTNKTTGLVDQIHDSTWILGNLPYITGSSGPKFTKYRRVGWVRNNAANDFVQVKCPGDRSPVMLLDPLDTLQNVSAGISTYNFSSFIPPGCELGLFCIYAYNPSNEMTIRTRINSNHEFISRVLGYDSNSGGGTYSDGANDFPQLLDNMSFDISFNAGYGNVLVIGYYDNV